MDSNTVETGASEEYTQELDAIFQAYEDSKVEDSVASKDDTETTAVKSEETVDKLEEKTDDESKEEVQDIAPIAPPTSWSSEHKEAFAKLPPDLQQVVADRESERETLLTQKTQELAQEKRELGEINDLLEPFGKLVAASGMTKSQGLGELLKIERFAREDPQGYIKWFAEGRGISLTDQGDDDFVDPQIAKLEKEISALKSQVQQTTQTIHQQPIAQESERAAAEFMADVKNFPHANEVSADMQLIIPHLMRPGMKMQEVLKAAYEQAVWANPVTRQKLLDAERANVAKKVVEDSASEAAKARKAAAGSPARGNSANTSKTSTLAEEVDAIWSKRKG